MSKHERETGAEGEESPSPSGSGAAGGVATAVGLALGGGRGGKLPPEAAEFLLAQKRLADVQLEHLHEERELHHRHLHLKYFGDRLRIGLQLLGLVVGAAAVFGVGVLIWQASQDHSLVVEAFDAPPDLAARGLTGKVFATKLQDKLTAMQAETLTNTEARRVSTGADNDIKVQIPETGVSIGDVSRYLHQWLGHETHVTGEVVHSAQPDGQPGLEITVRVGDESGVEASGADTDINTIVGHAAEAVYRNIQPVGFADWLREHGRGAEAVGVMQQLAKTGTPKQRAWADLYLAYSLPWASAAKRDLLQAAIRLDPDNAGAQNELGNYHAYLGEFEAALAAYRAATRAVRAQAGLSAEARQFAEVSQKGNEDRTLGDYAGALGDLRVASGSRLVGESNNTFAESWPLALDHDIRDARRIVDPILAVSDDNVAPGQHAPQYWSLIAVVIGDEELEDWNALSRDGQRMDDLVLLDPALAAPELRYIGRAIALAKLGRPTEAEALVNQSPLDCYTCVRARAKVAAASNNWAGADRWFAAADALGPSLPQATGEWAVALLAKGDPAGAIAKAKIAHQRSPHFPDAIEVWGEALMKQGDLNGAVAKFAETDRYAPRWGRNHLRWGQALAALGRHAEAIAQFNAARGMDLSATDQATLNGLPRS